ncbi:MAG: hypothetical protein M3437_00590 [Chloroflexota bacterium]|nr:hypothetical protein [Chloroflexota bacterium]MDQ5866358.1 hypothetical protein [Chloroflexota bacterium]
MTSEAVRIEPYLADIGVHAPQLEFVKRHIALLSPDFVMPHEDWRTGTNRQAGDGHYVSVWEFGAGQGYRVILSETLESRASGVVQRGILVETFGLTGGCSILSKYASSFAHAPYLELSVSGPDEVVATIAERFREEFGLRADGAGTISPLPGR